MQSGSEAAVEAKGRTGKRASDGRRRREEEAVQHRLLSASLLSDYTWSLLMYELLFLLDTD